jgi:hypothetical protein
MKRIITIFVVAGLIVVVSPMAKAIITVEPDVFPNNTVINNAYPGVTLTTLGAGPSGPMDPTVLALNSPYASTGERVFGHLGDYADLWGDGYFDWLRADFATGATQVSIDFIASDGSDTNATLNAFDAGDNLVDTVVAPGPYSTYQVVTLTVTAPNIAYITAKGDPINQFDNWALDNLSYEPIPAPGAILLGGIGLGFVGWLRRRRTL